MKELKVYNAEVIFHKHKIETQEVYLRSDVDDYIRQRCITWDEEDFEQSAKDLEEWYYAREENKDKPVVEIYDRSKFTEALYKMIHEHNAEIGISWDTISIYLDEYCKIDGYTIVCWPESQELMEIEAFHEQCELINDDYGLAHYGSSAYRVPNDFFILTSN